MNGGFGRAALAGVALAVVALLAGGVLLGLNLVDLPDRDKPVTRVVVVAVAPDEGGGEVAVLALLRDSVAERTELLDTDAEAPVAGTSARNAREAYPFGGGAMVARALAAQTGGQELPWIVLPATTWAALIDADGGVKTSIDHGISAYVGGSLTVVEPGQRTLSGQEAVALAAAVSYIEPSDRDPLKATLGTALSKAIDSSDRTLGELVASGEAKSDLEPSRLPPGF